MLNCFSLREIVRVNECFRFISSIDSYIELQKRRLTQIIHAVRKSN